MTPNILGSVLIFLVLLASVTIWVWIGVRFWEGRHPVPFRERPRLTGIEVADEEQPQPRWSPWAPLLVIAFLIWQLASSWILQVQQVEAEPSLQEVQASVILYGVLSLILLYLLQTRGARLRDFGVRASNWLGQVRDGTWGFLASLVPVFVVLLATQPLRSVETQHPFFRVMQDHPSPVVIAWVVTAAIVAAPLAEELMFRVVLQGWLQSFLSPGWAIGLVAVLFSVVHGWPDALPIFPLALVMGYVYYRRNSYWAVVTLHLLFNGFFVLVALLMGNGG